jgi:hypothetical protein
MPEKNRGLRIPPKIRIAREPVFVEGCKDASFIQVPLDLNALGVIYALLGRPSQQTHTDIFEEAIQSELISGDQEPTGGGVIDLDSFEYGGSSIHYREPDRQVVEKLTRHLQRKRYGPKCD